MSIVRTAKRENPFVQIDKYFLDDPNISWEAKGILTYVLSKPNNWTIRKTDLIKKSKSGKTRIESAMLELMANGYLNWYRLRENDGTFGEWVYDVYERPEFNPEAEKFISEGKARIESRKKRTKERNVKKVNDEQPKVDNQPLEQPKVDNPPVDNPPVDNQPYNNNESINNDFNNINLEEEEEASPIKSEMIEFLMTKNILLENAIKFDTRLKEEMLIGYTNEQVLEAIEWSLEQFEIGNCNEPYIYAVGRLRRVLDGKIKEVKSKPNVNKKNPNGKKGKVEVIPEWFDNRNSKDDTVLTEEQKEEFAKRKMEILRSLGHSDKEVI